jgi:hypothetical protein
MGPLGAGHRPFQRSRYEFAAPPVHRLHESIKIASERIGHLRFRVRFARDCALLSSNIMTAQALPLPLREAMSDH